MGIIKRNAFHGDGAIVVDAATGGVIAAGWFVSDISQGGAAGGARSRSARAVAQQAGFCYVIKCSEDSRGELELSFGTNTSKFHGLVSPDFAQLDPTGRISEDFDG